MFLQKGSELITAPNNHEKLYLLQVYVKFLLMAVVYPSFLSLYIF